MDTNLSVQQIQLALHNSGLWNKRSDIMVPNLSWGLLPYEADFVILSKNGYLTEVEIKRSWADFKADFNKIHRHNDERIYHFFYCVPVAIFPKVKDFLVERLKKEMEQMKTVRNNVQNMDDKTKEVYLENILRHSKLPAVLTFDENGNVKPAGFGYSGAYRNKCRKLFIEEQLQVARLGCLRYWKQQESIVKLPKSKQL